VNKSFLQSTVDKKEYSRTLLVDGGSAKGTRSPGAYRPTPHREGHSGRSSHKERSPRRDSPRPTSRTGLSSEPLADLIRKKRDRSTRSSSSPKRDKTRARTDRFPRPSPPPHYMGPPPPVTVSLHPDQEVKRPSGVLTPGGKKLRSEMLELRLF